MRDILPDLNRWHEERKPVVLATVVQTWGSSPRRVGAKMAVTEDSRVSGSVSGGCVENAVIDAALDVLSNGRARLLRFAVADEAAWGVGLACGGSIEIFVQPLHSDFFEAARTLWMGDTQAVEATVIRGPREILGNEMLIRDGSILYSTLGIEWEPAILALAEESLAKGRSSRVPLDDTVEVFFELISVPPTLIAIGGVHIATALVSLAKTLGYRMVVVDPRRSWGNEDRFPDVDRLVQSWPEQALDGIPLTPSSAVVTLTHDPKLDDPALKIALASPAFYVGALGSKAVQARRLGRLANAGLTASQLARLHAPVGLDIGAESPEEIALAIMAEVVEAYRKRSWVPEQARGMPGSSS